MSSDPSSSDIAAVRFLLGDIDVTPPSGETADDPVLTDAEIQFALDQNANIYGAAAICARALSARYARRVDTRFETVDVKYSQLRDSYEQLARSLDQQAKRRGAMGAPIAGGISRAEVETVQTDTDRVKPFFYDNIFVNPPKPNE